MKRRPLNPKDSELWDHVVRSIRPMHAKPIPLQDRATAKQSPTQVQIAPKPTLPPPPVTKKAHLVTLPKPVDPIFALPLRMDAKTHAAMVRGKVAPEARIDLHGQTLAQAHVALNRFILRCHAEGKRLVLVITGKGKESTGLHDFSGRPGILRHQVPYWLAIAPLAAVVSQVRQAHLRHGGEGAYYVYLRRVR